MVTLTHQGGGGHLAAGHAVNGVVDKDEVHIFSPLCGGVDNLGGADGSQVAVALIGEYQSIGVCPLHAGGNCGSAAVGGLQHIAH